MRYLVLSDVHANAFALEAVLRHARRKRWDQTIFLGDAVGYYTQPEQAVQLLIDLDPAVAILGNHDALLLGMAEGDAPDHREEGLVREVLQHHLDALSDDSLAFLAGLVPRAIDDSWEATHGALRRQWEYLSTLQNAQANAPYLERTVCLVGHTHVPRIFASVEGPSGELWRTVPFRGEQSSYRIPPRARLFFNPGSVGQPRDGIPLAAYAIFDADARKVEVYRVEYDLLGMQRSVRESGYPEALASRLAVGR